MSVQRHFDTLTVVASQDLTGHQFKPVGLHGGVAATSAAARGLLQNKAANGDHATLGYRGQMKAYAGAAINSDSLLGVTTSGFIIAVTNSDNVGRALVSAASGDLFTGVFDFTTGV